MPDQQNNRAYLSIGTNIDPENNIRQAVRMLARYGRVSRTSSVWESHPYGYENQPRFLNAAVLLETFFGAKDLKENALAEIERGLGRVRGENKYGPRPIDIDITLFNDEILALGSRRIPDPELMERDYVAIPLAEIAPDYRHPENNHTLAQIADSFISHHMRRRDDVVLAIAAEEQ